MGPGPTVEQMEDLVYEADQLVEALEDLAEYPEGDDGEDDS